jgi:hypothetical protein
MRGKRVALILQTMCVVSLVSAVSAVSGFSQSNTANRVVREYDADAAGPAGPTDVPPNIIASTIHRPLIRAMLQRSPTFRRQCLRIANTPDLLITIERNAALPWTRARTRIARQANGVVFAAVQVVSSENFEELIAHEFEHVIEQLDGIDLSSRARLASSGVSRGIGDANSFETVRAKRVGAIVSAEVRRGGN